MFFYFFPIFSFPLPMMESIRNWTSINIGCGIILTKKIEIKIHIYSVFTKHYQILNVLTHHKLHFRDFSLSLFIYKPQSVPLPNPIHVCQFISTLVNALHVNQNPIFSNSTYIK